jgi:aspartate 1-decarboxylase
MSAAKDLLDRAGLVKTEKVQVENNTGGVMILPAKEREEE